MKLRSILSLIIAILASSLPMMGQQASTNSSKRRVGLEVRQTQGKPTTVHRIPMLVNIEAYYNEEDNTLEVHYDGVEAGEVFLYLNNNLIGYDSEINSSFTIYDGGIYRLAIISENWIAEGELKL